MKKRVQKVYELTTNGDDGYRKFLVKGIKTDEQASKVAKAAFGKYYWKSGISFYDRDPSPYGHSYKYTPGIVKFMKLTKRYR
jgi:beta-N-acetylglucosaminidase